jgi:hypothetical protein
MGTLIIFFLSWAVGVTALFFYMKNKDKTLSINDVLITFILSGIIAVVFSFAAWKANLNHWALWVVFAGLGAYITHKLLDKKSINQSI